MGEGGGQQVGLPSKIERYNMYMWARPRLMCILEVCEPSYDIFNDIHG